MPTTIYGQRTAKHRWTFETPVTVPAPSAGTDAAHKTYTDAAIAAGNAALLGTDVPAALDTLRELADALTSGDSATDALTSTLASLSTSNDAKLPLAGGTVTGAISYAADPASANQLSRKSYIDAAVSAAAATAAAALAAAAGVSATFGDDASTTFTATHTLGTADVEVRVYEVDGGAEIDCEIATPDDETVVISGFTVAPEEDSLRVVILPAGSGSCTIVGS